MLWQALLRQLRRTLLQSHLTTALPAYVYARVNNTPKCWLRLCQELLNCPLHSQDESGGQWEVLQISTCPVASNDLKGLQEVVPQVSPWWSLPLFQDYIRPCKWILRRTCLFVFFSRHKHIPKSLSNGTACPQSPKQIKHSSHPLLMHLT